jgi:hypothetical protein
MPLFISQADVATTLNCSPQTVGDYMRGSNSFVVNKHPHYPLTEVLHFMDRKARHKIEHLVEISEDNGELYAGLSETANSFEAYLNTDRNFFDRAKWIRNQFVIHLALADGVRAYLAYYETALRSKVFLNSGITRFVLTGDKSGLPNGATGWANFAPSFALVNSGLESKVAA